MNHDLNFHWEGWWSLVLLNYHHRERSALLSSFPSWLFSFLRRMTSYVMLLSDDLRRWRCKKTLPFLSTLSKYLEGMREAFVLKYLYQSINCFPFLFPTKHFHPWRGLSTSTNDVWMDGCYFVTFQLSILVVMFRCNILRWQERNSPHFTASVTFPVSTKWCVFLLKFYDSWLWWYMLYVPHPCLLFFHACFVVLCVWLREAENGWWISLSLYWSVVLSLRESEIAEAKNTSRTDGQTVVII